MDSHLILLFSVAVYWKSPKQYIWLGNHVQVSSVSAQPSELCVVGKKTCHWMGLSGTSSSLGHCPLPVPQALSSALETRGQAGAVKAAGMKGHQGQFTLGFLYFQKEALFQEEGYCMFCLQFTILWSHWNQGLGARPSWFADQFCHSPAEGPWPSDGNSMSLSLIVCLVSQRLNRFLYSRAS